MTPKEMLRYALHELHRRECRERRERKLSGIDVEKISDVAAWLSRVATAAGVSINISCEPTHPHEDWRRSGWSISEWDKETKKVRYLTAKTV